MMCQDCGQVAASVDVVREEAGAQVLVRQVCPACSRSWIPSRGQARWVELAPAPAPPAPLPPAPLPPAPLHSGVSWCLGPGEVCPPAPRLWGRPLGTDRLELEVGGAEGDRRAAGWTAIWPQEKRPA